MIKGLVVHSFDPISKNVVDDEIIIDDNTLWVASCQKDDPNAPTITNQMYLRLQQLYEALSLKSKNLNRCVECQVSDFRDELELLDFMPLSEIFRNDEDEDTDDEDYE